MKITRHITTMLFKATISLLTLAFVACKSEIEASLTDTDTLEFGVNLIMLPDTRTHLGDKTDNHYELLWSAGDKISVNGYQSEEVPNEYVNSVMLLLQSQICSQPLHIAWFIRLQLWIVKIIQKYIFLLPIATQKQVFLLVHQLQLLKHPILSIYT